MAAVDVVLLRKAYGDMVALDSVSIEARSGELVTLLGPSGCGKSTTLRCLAGFLDPDGGDIRVEGRSVVKTPSNRRDFGVVFQNYALFPHMTVAENIGYGLLLRKLPKAQIGARVAKMLDMVRLTGLADRLPREISGGQQQRVALARALIIDPRLLLLDEPLANLDARLRDEVRWLIRDLQQMSRTTAFYVTHDQSEAMAISDKIAVMKKGKVAQFATPQDIYQRPCERYVADFTGEANFLPATVLQVAAPGSAVVRVGGTEMQVKGVETIGRGDHAELLLRPEALKLVAPDAAGATFRGKVSKSVFLGAAMHCEIELNDGAGKLKLSCDANAELLVGSAAAVELDRAHAWLMPVLDA